MADGAVMTCKIVHAVSVIVIHPISHSLLPTLFADLKISKMNFLNTFLKLHFKPIWRVVRLYYDRKCFTNYFWAHHIIVRLRTPPALLIPKGISAYYLIPLLSYPVRKDCRYCQIAEPCTFLFSTEATISMLTNSGF